MTRDGVIGCLLLFAAMFIPSVVEQMDVSNGLLFAVVVGICAVLCVCIGYLRELRKQNERL